MVSLRLAVVLLALTGLAPAAHAQTRAMVDGREWQRSTLEERRAYLIGISNAISAGARYDQKNSPGQQTFAVRAQTGLAGQQLTPAIDTLDAWYKAHPDQLDKPVLSVIWREMAKEEAK
jgi:hypothetical protein